MSWLPLPEPSLAEVFYLKMTELLNPHQRISVATTLSNFEASLLRALDWLAEKEMNGSLYRKRLGLPAVKRLEA